MNQNISDKFFLAMEEYNAIVKKGNLQKDRWGHTTYEIKRGLLFTTLRRHFDIFKNVTRNYSSSLKVQNLECVFNEDNTVHSVKINKTYPFNLAWDDNGDDKALLVFELRKITDAQTKIYNSPILNELSQIVNSIKI